nr:hypothetical protein [Tanacetum cinerariifolium]
MESSTSCQPNQPYPPVNRINLVMIFMQLMFRQEHNYSQDYSMGHGTAHGLAHGLTHGSVLVNDDEEGDSPVEDVSPVKPKKPSRRTTRAKNDDPKEPQKIGQWRKRQHCAKFVHHEVIARSLANEKNKVRPRIGAFCAIINNVEENHESGTNELDVYHKACVEYKMMYKQDFTLEHCYNVLKDHLASGGYNLNDEADEAMEETQKLRPMGRDRSKAKKKSVGSSREGSSSFVYLVADKFVNMKQKKWGKRNEQQQSYIDLKNRGLSIREAEVRKAAQLKRDKLEIQRRTLELAEREKRDIYILFYNSVFDPCLPLIQQEKLLEMKMEIKERYNLDY